MTVTVLRNLKSGRASPNSRAHMHTHTQVVPSLSTTSPVAADQLLTGAEETTSPVF